MSFPHKRSKIRCVVQEACGENWLVRLWLPVAGESERHEYSALIGLEHIRPCDRGEVQPGCVLSIPGRRDVRQWQLVRLPRVTKRELRRARIRARRRMQQWGWTTDRGAP